MHWHGQPKGVVESLFLGGLKNSGDVALGDLVSGHGGVGVGVGLGGLGDHFNP